MSSLGRAWRKMQETGDAASTAMGSPVSPEQVLKTLMNDGHFDSLRVKILNQLKQSVSFIVTPLVLLRCAIRS